MDTVLSLLPWLPDTHPAQPEVCETILPLRDDSVDSKSCMRVARAGQKSLIALRSYSLCLALTQITSLGSAQGSQRKEKHSWEPQLATEHQE